MTITKTKDRRVSISLEPAMSTPGSPDDNRILIKEEEPYTPAFSKKRRWSDDRITLTIGEIDAIYRKAVRLLNEAQK